MAFGFFVSVLASYMLSEFAKSLPGGDSPSIFNRRKIEPADIAQADYATVSEGMIDVDPRIVDSADEPLQRASDMIRYLLTAYGPEDEDDSFYSGTGFGGYGACDNYLDSRWATHSARHGYSLTYDAYDALRVSLKRVTDVDAVLDQIESHTPGVFRNKDEDGKYRLCIRRIEPDLTGSYVYSRGIIYRSDTAESDILEWGGISHGDYNQIRTRVVIEYAYDWLRGKYTRKATCDSDGSDDGYGNDWADAITNTVTPAESLLSEAKSRVGEERELPISLPYTYYPSGAVAVGNYHAAFRYKPPATASFIGGLWLNDLMVGQYVYFDQDSMPFEFPVYNFSTNSGDSPWEDNLWLVTSKQHTVGQNRVSGIRFGLELAPYTVGAQSKIIGGQDYKGMAGPMG